MKISWDFIKEELNRNNFRPRATGFYVHFPFCQQKCPYCHFYSFKGKEDDWNFWLAAIKNEMEIAASSLSEFMIIDTIYLGGGSPSLLAPEKIKEILEGLTRRYFARPLEITLEANPDGRKEWLKGWRGVGVNRLSIGAQSFDDHLLRILRRRHSARENLEFFIKAREAGFENINIDLMIGLPGETYETVRNNLQAIDNLKPEHISLYMLEELENVPFRKIWEENPISEDDLARIYTEYQQALTERSYRQYEISNFARPGYECRHNLKYWRYLPYIGLGPSAGSHLGPVRWQNVAELKSWAEAVSSGSIAASEFINLRREDSISERLAFGLRLTEGIDWSEFKNDYPDFDFSAYEKKIAELISLGSLKLSHSRLSIPVDKFLVTNAILSELIFV
ncbi:MAG: radical SAM family heme chaperone HemW [Candidatus Aminicenantes bacterium]|nr:radical SAM family heme chaperone HemW [Candidatus Aminicenantes bacterium]